MEAFESSLPFASLYIDDFEQLVMAVAKVKKVNGVYQPELAYSSCQLRRIVKYFKGIDDKWSDLRNSQSNIY